MSNFPPYSKQSISALKPYENNARVHSETQIEQLADSIREFGFINPVIVDAENGIIAGHGRVRAAQLLGLDEVPTIEVTHLTDAQRRAYVMADNQLALIADWDTDLLKIELTELAAADFDLDLIGFSSEQLDSLLGKVDTTEESEGLSLNDLSYQVIVDCDDEAHQGRLLEKFEEEGYTCRALIL